MAEAWCAFGRFVTNTFTKLRVEKDSADLWCLTIIVLWMAIVVAAKAGRGYSDHS
jgi:hypothetical protein